MRHVTSGSRAARSQTDDARSRRRLTMQIKGSLRDLRNQLSILNRQVSGKVELRETDLDCLDLISRGGPLTPSTLARRARLHPATLTGILDRLEKTGWIVRQRDPADRRAVTLRALPNRGRELFQLFGGMNAAMDDICAGYTDEELKLIVDFLAKANDAGDAATRELGR